MRAKIVRLISGSYDKTSTCVVCGETKRKNKSLFEVSLPCGYSAEVRICRSCTGEEGNMRGDTIEMPYSENQHYHLQDHKTKTFWDYVDCLTWIKAFMQEPTPTEVEPGVYQLRIPQRDFLIVRCDGVAPRSVAAIP